MEENNGGLQFLSGTRSRHSHTIHTSSPVHALYLSHACKLPVH